MARIQTKDGEKETPEINQNDVKQFFVERAKKIGKISYKQAVIYQDNNAKLAEARDRMEKQLLLPKLNLSTKNRVLDIGCGTGRWAEVIADKVARYHGTDLIDALLDVARKRINRDNATFTCIPCTRLSLNGLGVAEPFDKVVMFGVLMYLNDNDLESVLNAVVEVSSDSSSFLMREPVGIEHRLTIKEHFSDDMEQWYNAIYRTPQELMTVCEKTLGKAGFTLLESDDVFQDSALNNRKETKQKYFLFQRTGKA